MLDQLGKTGIAPTGETTPDLDRVLPEIEIDAEVAGKDFAKRDLQKSLSEMSEGFLHKRAVHVSGKQRPDAVGAPTAAFSARVVELEA